MNKVKYIMMFIYVAAITFNLASCNSNNSEPNDNQLTARETTVVTESVEDNKINIFTPEELKQYNGEDGKPMYVAIDGVIYDVTDVSAWFGGQHRGNKAGNDLTRIIEESPHGKSVLDNLKIIGRLE